MKALSITHAYPTDFDGLAFVDDALRTLDRVWRAPALGRSVRSAWTGAPDFSLETSDEGWTLRAELPGVPPEGLSLEAQGDRLTVRGERKVEAPEGYRALRQERPEASFERSFRFERGFDAENIKAELKDGLLKVSVPRRAEEKPRAIQIEVA